MSVVSWLVYGDLSEQPACVSEVVAELARSVNDLLPDYRRQALKSYIPRLIDTNDGDSTERARHGPSSAGRSGVASAASLGAAIELKPRRLP